MGLLRKDSQTTSFHESHLIFISSYSFFLFIFFKSINEVRIHQFHWWLVFVWDYKTCLEWLIFSICEFVYKYKVTSKAPANTSSLTKASWRFQVKRSRWRKRRVIHLKNPKLPHLSSNWRSHLCLTLTVNPHKHIENIEALIDYVNVWGVVKCKLFTTTSRKGAMMWYMVYINNLLTRGRSYVDGSSLIS